MATLIKSATIVDPKSPLHGKKRDLLIDKGNIVSIAAAITATPKMQVIKEKGMIVSPGWIDLRANFRDPGHEYKESLGSGIDAAARGGFKTVVLMPSTYPVIDSKSQIEYIYSRTQDQYVRVLPTGSLSEKMEGKQLSEMYDMDQAGAIAFTDDKHNVGTELMTRALEYSKNFDGLIMTFPYDRGMVPAGMVHEGPTSVAMGLKGIPSVAEELRLSRDIDLLRYTGGRMHVSLISTAKSVDMISKAKKEGLNITCAVADHQLNFIDEDMMEFDSELKVLPPFRSKEDRKALIAGLKDGTIDAICSDHSPEDIEHKDLEFEYANFGISSLETAFCSAFTALDGILTVEEIIDKFVDGPLDILGLDRTIIREGEPAVITLFSSAETTVFDADDWISKSKNSPFLNRELKGRVIL